MWSHHTACGMHGTLEDLSSASFAEANPWQNSLTDSCGMGDLYSEKQHLFYMILVY